MMDEDEDIQAEINAERETPYMKAKHSKRERLGHIGLLVGVLIIIALVALLAASPGGPGLGGPGGSVSHDQSWYKYCGDLAGRIAQAYREGYEPTGLIQQYGVCDKMAECQSHPPPSFGLGDPCVPSGEPPPLLG